MLLLGLLGLDIFEDQRRAASANDEFEADDGGSLSRAHYTAKRSALMSLGYLINRTGSQRALDYVTQGARPET